MISSQVRPPAPHQRIVRRFAPLLLAISAGVSGCRQSDTPPIVKVYPVAGKVLLANGNPLSGGQVYFIPANDGLISASGPIGSDGTFSLTTGESGEGAPPGDYKVRIEPERPKPAAGKSGQRIESFRPPFPSKYTDEDASELRVTVRAEPNQLEPFRLK